ncbi:MAG: hypothetical protein M3Y56_06045 [Armatimonadota bacterium]|nr:hypothetical protein [Armatimonadota bacterium]
MTFSSLFRLLRNIRALAALQLVGTFLGFCTTLIFSEGALRSMGQIDLNADGNKFTVAILSLALANFAPPVIVRVLRLPVRWLLLFGVTTAVNALGFWAIGHFTGGYEVAGWLALVVCPILMGLVTGTFAWMTAKVL